MVLPSLKGLFRLIAFFSLVIPSFATNLLVSKKAIVIPTVTILDVLSSNSNFSSFIRSLQHSDLIDYVNGLENVTLLAPTNTAFKNLGISTLLLNESVLNRFIVDHPVRSKDLDGVRIYDTLNHHASPFLKSMHVPILFDKEPDGFYVENSVVSIPDLVAPASNSVVHGLNSLLIDKKMSFCDFFSRVDFSAPNVSISIFSKLLSVHNLCESAKFTNVTLLIPSDNYLSTLFSSAELDYLFSPRGAHDRLDILSNFILKGLYGGNLGTLPVKTQNFLEQSVSLSSHFKGSEIRVDNVTSSTTANFLLSDAIIHYFDSEVLQNPQIPTFTPRKFLEGMNETDFVDEVDFRKLSYLIDDTSLNQTIFIPEDLPSLQSGDLARVLGQAKNNLLYQFVEGNVVFDGNKLLTSKFCSQTSLGHCQKIKLSVRNKDSILINDHYTVRPTRYSIANTYIYFVDDDYSVPPKLENAMTPVDRCAKTLQYLDTRGVLKGFKSNGGLGYTVFLPTSDAWSSLDLTLDFLKDHEDYLTRVLKNMALNGLVYGDFEGNYSFQSLAGDNITLERPSKKIPFVKLNGEYVLPFSFESEILFKDGVAFPINQVVFPKNLTIGVQQLIETVHAKEFLSILEAVNLTGLISDTEYSFLVPSSATLKMSNITSFSREPDFLREFALMHILPENSMQKIINCEPIIPTLLNNTHLTCHRIASGGLMLQILEGNDREVRILRQGWTTSKSGILLLDKPLNPDWLDSHNGPSIHLRLPLVSVFIGIILGMVILASVVSFCFVFTLGSEKKAGTTFYNDDQDPGNDQQVQNVYQDQYGDSNPINGTSENTTLLQSASQAGYGSIPSTKNERINGNSRNGNACNAKVGTSSGFIERYSEHSKARAINCPQN